MHKLTNEQKNELDLRRYGLIQTIIHRNYTYLSTYSEDQKLVQKVVIQLERMSMDVLEYLGYSMRIKSTGKGINRPTKQNRLIKP